MRRKDKMKLKEYLELVGKTNKFRKKDEVQPLRLGLYGEVGSIMSAMKKYQRENLAVAKHKVQLIEELGDTFWYLCALCLKLGVPLEDLVADACRCNYFSFEPVSEIDVDMYYANLIEVAEAAAALISPQGENPSHQEKLIKNFMDTFFRLMGVCKVRFNDVLDTNYSKVNSMFGPQLLKGLPNFDEGFSEYEKLPWKFKIEVCERTYGKNSRVYTRMGEVFIGNPLTDNISKEDGFRYHDVIHLAHVAILHWSPTFRGLLKRKRRSDKRIDEVQDGGRARVVEEGLTALVFSKAKELDYFEGHDRISIDLLKTIQEFVRGYEVEACPLWLWERCILRAYEVLQLVRKNKGGIILGDRGNRTLRYKPLS